MAKDMTQGSLVGTLMGFSLPLILGGILQQLYNWADAFIVGNVEGELSLAAVGATGTISNLFVMVITGFTLGISIFSAQQYGKGKIEDLKKILSSFMIVLGCVFLAAGILGGWRANDILRALHTPEDIFGPAKEYLQIIFIGIPFIAVYNVYSAVLRGLGDSRAPFLSVLVSAVVNVVLDLMLIGLFRYGVKGAAAATVVSQIWMTIFIIYYARKKYPGLRLKFDKNMIDRTILYQGFQLGLPPAVQSSVTSFGNLILQNFMNGFGTQTVAAITTAYRIDSVIMLPIINLGSGISTVVAQNIGAGNQERAKKAYRVGTMMMAIVSIVLTLLVIPFGGNLIAIFGVTEEAVLIGKNFFLRIAGFYIVYGIAMSMRGFLEGTGDVLFSSIAGIVSLGARIILSYRLVLWYNNMVIAYAEAFSWGILLLMYAPRCMWRRKHIS